MTNKSRESVKTTQNDFLPTTTSSGKQDRTRKVAGEISKAADTISAFERMAEVLLPRGGDGYLGS